MIKLTPVPPFIPKICSDLFIYDYNTRYIFLQSYLLANALLDPSRMEVKNLVKLGHKRRICNFELGTSFYGGRGTNLYLFSFEFKAIHFQEQFSSGSGLKSIYKRDLDNFKKVKMVVRVCHGFRLKMFTELLIFEPILTTFKLSIIFSGTQGSIENWLQPKIKPPSGN